MQVCDGEGGAYMREATDDSQIGQLLYYLLLGHLKTLKEHMLSGLSHPRFPDP